MSLGFINEGFRSVDFLCRRTGDAVRTKTDLFFLLFNLACINAADNILDPDEAVLAVNIFLLFLDILVFIFCQSHKEMSDRTPHGMSSLVIGSNMRSCKVTVSLARCF